MSSSRHRKAIYHSPRELYYNEPQVKTYHVGAHRTYCIWGRGTGKTSNALAPRLAAWVQAMPRSLIALVGVSYAQHLERVLPAMVSGWERMGYKENIHFFVRKFAPEKYGWSRSYLCPQIGSHVIHWYNGAVITLVSQDRPGLANGLSFDAIAGDEARFLNYEQLLELLPALRGNREYFGDLACHQAQMFTTDMPTDGRGAWLFDFEKESISSAQKEEILTLVRYLSILYQQQINAPPSQKIIYQRQIQKVEKGLNELRKNTVFFSMASTLDNAYALGIESIQHMEKTMSPKKFQAAVLNLRNRGVERGFYALFEPQKFGYYGDNHDFLDDPRFILGSSRDCRWDKHYDAKKPLEMGGDFGGYFNCCVVGQERRNLFRVMNYFWAEHPESIDAVFAQLADYYRHTQCKEINFYYDHTAKDRKKDSSLSYLNEWQAAAKKYGWKLNPIFIGHTCSPEQRYLLWQRTFKNDPDLCRFKYHFSTCQDLELAIQLTEIREGSKGVKKNKNTEKPDGANNFPIPQEHAPHGTDALDTLWTGIQLHRISNWKDWKMPAPLC